VHLQDSRGSVDRQTSCLVGHIRWRLEGCGSSLERRDQCDPARRDSRLHRPLGYLWHGRIGAFAFAVCVRNPVWFDYEGARGDLLPARRVEKTHDVKL
jgi:hypothetical protein